MAAIGGRACAALVLVALSGCSDATGPGGAPWPGLGMALVTDVNAGVWLAQDLLEAEPAWVLNLDEAAPDACGGKKWCAAYQARFMLGLDGRTKALLTWSGLGSDDFDDRTGRVAVVDLPGVEASWTIDRLDFSGLPGVSRCAWLPEDPCTPDPAARLDDQLACLLLQPHEVELAYQSEERVDVWVADSRNSRLLRLAVTPGDRCAKVEEHLDASHPGWAGYIGVNAFEHWEDGDGEHLVLSMKDSDQDTMPYGGVGRGRITGWTRGADGEWAREWEFPSRDLGEDSFVNVPHGVQRSRGPDGEDRVMFAHSLSLSDVYNDGEGGTITAFRVDDGVPTYLWDIVPEGEVLRFPRDASPMEDGLVLVTDSGCYAGECEDSPAVWVLHVPDAEPGSGSGAWTADGAELDVREAEVVVGPLLSESNLLYSGEWALDVPEL
jgi:hypothetical protein